MQTVSDSDVIWLQVPVVQTQSLQASRSTPKFRAKLPSVRTWWMIVLMMLACPGLVCSFNRGNIEGLTLKMWCLCYCMHSCQALLGVNLRPWTCICLMQAGVFCFFASGRSILNSIQHMWQWKEEAVLCWICMRNFKSHFRLDFWAYCTSPVSMHLAVACICCSLNSFSVFLLV